MDSTYASVLEGVVAAISTKEAEECNRASGEELTEEDEKSNVDLARNAKKKKLNSRKQFEAVSREV